MYDSKDERTCSVATMAQCHVPWPNATTASQSLAVVGTAIVTPTTATQGPPTVVMPSRTLSSPPFTSSGGAAGGWEGGGGGGSGQSTELEPYIFPTDCNQLLSEVFEWASEGKEDNKMKK